MRARQPFFQRKKTLKLFLFDINFVYFSYNICFLNYIQTTITTEWSGNEGIWKLLGMNHFCSIRFTWFCMKENAWEFYFFFLHDWSILIKCSYEILFYLLNAFKFSYVNSNGNKFNKGIFLVNCILLLYSDAALETLSIGKFFINKLNWINLCRSHQQKWIESNEACKL